MEENDHDMENAKDEGGPTMPPEIMIKVHKFQAFKQNTKAEQEGIAYGTQLSKVHLRRCKIL